MGSGMAGISAADAALARGKKVMVFEKKPYQGEAVSNCPIAYLSIRNDKDCIDVKYDELPAELEETAKNAARDCAVTAIYLKK